MILTVVAIISLLCTLSCNILHSVMNFFVEPHEKEFLELFLVNFPIAI